MAIQLDPLGNRLVSCSRDKTVKVWDTSYYMDIADFRQKAKSGKIGAQMGKKEVLLVDKINMKTVNNLTKQTTQLITQFM